MDPAAVDSSRHPASREEGPSLQQSKEVVKDWIFLTCLFLTILVLVWFLTPLRGELRQSREAMARSMLMSLEVAAKMYELDHQSYPPGDGSGTATLTKHLRTAGPKKLPYFELGQDGLDREGHVRNPVDDEKFLYYRCPGIHKPKSFDLWGEDAKGRRDGVNNWSKE